MPVNPLPTSLPPPGSTSDAPKTYQEASNSLAMGPDYEATIASLMGLGNYTHQQVVQALRAAYNNPDRAADYLFNGIPSSILAQQQEGGGGGGTGRGTTTTTTSGPPTTTSSGGGRGTTTSSDETGGGSGGGGGGGGGGGDQFATLRQLMQTNPQIVPLLLQQIAQTNPQLVQALASNPQAMQAVLQSLAQGGGLPGLGGGGGGRGGGGGLGSMGTVGTGGGRGSGGSTPGVVTLTADEKKSVDNLEALGFGRSKALEAFLLCERNEQLAANYLFDHSGDGESGITFGFGGPGSQDDDMAED